MSNTVKARGRAVYIEPNNLASLNYDYANNTSPDNIMWNPEELEYSVDLQAIIPSRTNSGERDYMCDGNRILLSEVKDNNTPINRYLSFMGGENIKVGDKENPQLTVNYIDASYTEVVNGNISSKECLYIDSISISFNQNFYPQVNMKLTDVRGYALMMPAEYEYRENLKNGKEKGTAFRNFYRAVFTEPFPLFYLTVKGYFGTPVTLVLAVSNTQTALDPATGNFTLSIDFVGYNQGLYGDLPMEYLMVAPEITYGDNESYWRGRNFSYNDGSSMQSYLDFWENFAKYSKNAGGGEEINAINQEYAQISNALSALTTDYTKILEEIEHNCSGKYQAFKTTKGIVLFSNTEMYCSKVSYDAIVKEITNIKAMEHFKDVEGTLEDKFLGDVNNSDKDKVFIKDRINKDLIGKDKIDETIANEIAKVETADSNIIKTISDNKTNYATVKYTLIIEYDKWYNSLKDLCTAFSKKGGENTVDERLINAFKAIADFVPSVENIYRMLFAHLDCFMSVFYSTLSNIRTNLKNRTFNHFHISNQQETDVIAMDSAVNGESTIPPFPAIYKYDNNGIKYLIYPGDDPRFADMEELKLVEAIITATKVIGERDTLDNTNDMEYTASFIPIMPTDIYYRDENPYEGMRVMNGNDNSLVRPFYMFALRIIAAKAFNNDSGFLGKCAVVEARNYYKVYKSQKSKVLASFNNTDLRSLYKTVLNLLLYPDGKENPQVLVKLNTDSDVSYKDENAGVYAFLKDKSLNANANNGSLRVYNDATNATEFTYTFSDTDRRYDVSATIENIDRYFREYNMPKTIDSFKKATDEEFSEQKNWGEALGLYTTFDNSMYKCNPKHIGRLRAYSEDNTEVMTDECSDANAYADLCAEAVNNSTVGQYKDVQFNSLNAYSFDTSGNGKLTFVNILNTVNTISFRDFKYKTQQTTLNFFTQKWFSSGTDDNRLKCLFFLSALPFSTGALKTTIEDISTYGIKKVRRCILLYIGGLIYRYHWNLNHPLLDKGTDGTQTNYFGDFMYPFTIMGTTNMPNGFKPLKEPSGGEDFWGYIINGYYYKYCRIYNDGTNCISVRNHDGCADYRSTVRGGSKQNIYEDLGSAQQTLNLIAKSKIGIAIMNMFKKWADGDGSKLLNSLLFSSNSTPNASSFEPLGKTYILKRGGDAEKNLIKFYLDNTFVFNLDASQNGNRVIDYGILEKFAKELNTIFSSGDGDEAENSEEEEKEVNEENDITKNVDVNSQTKLAVYSTLKTLYDKWLGSYSVDRFKLDDSGVVKNNRNLRFDVSKAGKIERTLFFKPKEFESMIFVDSYFNDISDTYMMDFTKLWHEIDLIKKGKRNKSVYEVMSEIANENKLMLYTLPMYSNFYTKDNIGRIFKPNTRVPVNERNIGHTFICMYNYEPAKQLSDKGADGQYSKEVFFVDDGFNLDRVMDDDVPIELFPKINSEDTSKMLTNYCVPCFGVTFGKQSQSYFKNISVNMGDFNNTNYGIATQLALASTADKDGSIAIAEGQDIYSIYSNRTYSASVTMFGCMNIVPLMYFQLNNVGLFKGAYMITNVTHAISAGHMETTFKGTKISMSSVPVDNNSFNILSSSNLFVAAAQGQATVTTDNTNDNGEYDYTLYSDYASDGNRKLYPKYGENCRDLGGVGPIKYGILYRGGVYSDDGNYKAITEIGVDAEIAVGSGHCLKVSLWNYNNWDKCYHNMDTSDACIKKGVDSLTHLMQWVVEGHHVFIHCARGCDRTGHIVCIIEGICGCSLEQMIKDYTMSNEANKRWKAKKKSKHGYSVRDGSSIKEYVKRYGKNAAGAELQKNFINYWVGKGISRTLINNFVRKVTNS